MREEQGKDNSFLNGFGNDIYHRANDLKRVPTAAPVALPRVVGHPDYAALLEADRIRPTDVIEQPPACLLIEKDGKEYVIASLGDLSTVTGRAKTKKTFVVSFAVAAAVACTLILDRLKGKFSANQNVILLFDTEQSHYHVLKLVKRICRLAGIDDPSNLIVYSLRRYPPDQRLNAIDYAIRTTPGVGLVIIDGVRDLAIDPILNGDDASRIMTHLLHWTAEFNIHVMTVLHQNKADRNVRGILGSELVNKSETVIEVTRDEVNKDVSHIEPKDCRNPEFPAFSFSIGDDGLPYLVETGTINDTSTSDGRRRRIPIELTAEQIESIIRRAFANDSQLQYSPLRTNIIEASEYIGATLSKSKAEGLITRSLNEGYLIKAKTATQRYQVY